MVTAAQLHRVATAAGREAGGVPAELLGDYLEIVLDAAATGRRLTAAELAACRDRGGDAARARVALRELVDLYLSATWRVWRLLPMPGSHRVERLRDAGEAVLRAADDAVASATEGYQLARRAMIRHEVADRREFIDDLLSGRSDVAGLVERAAQYGLQLAGPHAVIVVAAATPFTDASPAVGRIERDLEADLARADRGGVLVASKAGRLVCVTESDRDDLPDRLLRHLPRDRPRLGVGRGYPGPAGVLRSYDEALAALDIADRLDLDDRLVRFADLLVYQVLTRDRGALVDLVRAVLQPLTSARGGAEPLLATLAAYFAASTITAETARRLHLSVRAVTYRMERIRLLTGQDPDDPAQRFTLQAAVLGARLIDWPHQPLPDAI